MGRISRWLVMAFALVMTGAAIVPGAGASAAENGVVRAPVSGTVAADERQLSPLAGTYKVPSYRSGLPSPRLVVCAPDSARRVGKLSGALGTQNKQLLRECAYKSIQSAVDAVKTRGTTIYVLPGRYREERSRKKPSGRCAKLAAEQRDPARRLTYEEERACPTLRNLIGIFGDEHPDDGRDVCDGPRCDLQIEGTGKRAGDVLIDGGYTRDRDWAKSTGIRADRADGLYVRNLTARTFGASGIRVVQTDGFVLDRVAGQRNGRQGLLVHGSDHGVIAGCTAEGNGDAGIATDSVADLRGTRASVEVRECESRRNLVGYSGTAGDSVYVHDNEFEKNSVGVSVDSATMNRPGMPQNNAHFVANRIHGNNADHYRNVSEGRCAKAPGHRSRKGRLCPLRAVPVGTGLLLAGGDENTFASNVVYGNWRYGAAQFWVPASERGENGAARYRDTSHGNRYVGNLMGFTPDGRSAPNGTDFWWDEQGERNCWQDNTAPGNGPRTDPWRLPGCGNPSKPGNGNPAKVAIVAACLKYRPENPRPAGCPWLY